MIIKIYGTVHIYNKTNHLLVSITREGYKARSLSFSGDRGEPFLGGDVPGFEGGVGCEFRFWDFLSRLTLDIDVCRHCFRNSES